MQKLTIADTWNILEYEKIRDGFRQRIIEVKKKRRVALGAHITLVFENRDTALFQIQEMIRIERLVDEAQITQEIETYNTLIPDEGELSATLFVEAPKRSALHPLLHQLLDLDQHVTLHIGDRFAIPARFEAGRSRADRLSAVQYLRFPFTTEGQEALCKGHEPVTIVIDHPHYQATATLSAETRTSLAQDFE